MRTSMERLKRPLTWLGVASVVAVGSILYQGWNPLQAQPQPAAQSTEVRGTVQSMTTAPRGEIDGATLDSGASLHWPPHMQDRFTNVIKVGDQVRATGRTETGPAGDTHFEVQSVTNLRSNALVENPDFANGPPRPGRGPRDRAGRMLGPALGVQSPAIEVRGNVQRMTTAPRGEIDGAVLDNRTWLHWPPHMQDRFANLIKQGDEVRATGRTETGPAGDTHFEVQNVTNLKTNATAENPDFVSGPPAPASGPQSAWAVNSADIERRFQNLQNQIDSLRREIEQLRR
jgi:hypothetical protein